MRAAQAWLQAANHPLSGRALYKRLLTVARMMPTVERQRLIEFRAREGFEEARGASQGEIEEKMVYGEVMLDQLEIQCEHLNQLYRDGHLKNGTTPRMERGEVTTMENGARVVAAATAGCAKLTSTLTMLQDIPDEQPHRD